MNAMHNFQRGQGKSQSLFLFTDNKALMIKTLKKKEVDVLFDQDDNFLVEYFKHLQKNPDSLLARILGVFEVSVSE